MLMFLQLISFEFKGDVHLLHNKQEVELQFCGSEGWVKDIYSGYTALHEAHTYIHTWTLFKLEFKCSLKD